LHSDLAGPSAEMCDIGSETNDKAVNGRTTPTPRNFHFWRKLRVCSASLLERKSVGYVVVFGVLLDMFKPGESKKN
jgi:hypothetical protein